MNITEENIQKIVEKNYGFNCKVKPLAGYVDLNFQLVKSDDSKCLLKICKSEVTNEEIEFQIAILNHLKEKDISFVIPEVLRNLKGEPSFNILWKNKNHSVRMHSWVEGRMLADVNPRTPELLYTWGAVCGELSKSLQDFDHSAAHRFDEWNPVESLYSKKYLEYIETAEKKKTAEYFWDLVEESALPFINELRKSVNYSDAHEYNLLVSEDLKNPMITGVIDFGDAIFAPTICELAIACAYAGMFASDPISAMSKVVKGYNAKFKIEDIELQVLFPLICGRLMISAAHAAYKYHIDPENEYHQISAKPAWNLLEKLKSIVPQLAHFAFRSACGIEPHSNANTFRSWLTQNKELISSPIETNGMRTAFIDLSVSSLDLGNNANFETISRFSRKIDEILDDKNAEIGIGGYGEVRPFYTTDAYKVEGNSGPEWRTMHLGTDYWTDTETEVLAMADGVVYTLQNNDNPCDYGPTVILKHQANEIEYYTLYGHLSPKSLSHLNIGQKVKKGEVIAWIGAEDVNGEWPPHLHFQIMLDLLGNVGDFPGVAFVHEADIWLSICPSLPSIKKPRDDKLIADSKYILENRNKHLGRSLSVSYLKPLHMVRGFGVYLYDNTARRYIDTINNVAHVGHEHPRVVHAAQRQMELLNTNTRYLHKNIIQYAESLLSNCPDEMEVVYFVNSGSEANELALRMAKIYSSQNDIIALEMGYHGNTGGCIDISSYKFDGKGGKGAPEFTSICRMPDIYRGPFKDVETAGKLYAADVQDAILKLKEKGRNVAGFIAESILSCGGQIMLPPDYLKECYRMVRVEGGLCIADEVQVGFGRVGEHFWAFELQDVVPDIITCGKPIGNGHPLAAVITTRKVANTFTNGMEYFNTFGGNPVSCAIGIEVLAVIKDEKLQENAKKVGLHLLEGLHVLKDKYPIIGDVRGIGLFLGFELVKYRTTLEPAAEQATYLVNRMRDLGILMSTDGPLSNVIKIKPPMCITKEHIDEILMRLDQVFKEDFMSML